MHTQYTIKYKEIKSGDEIHGTTPMIYEECVYRKIQLSNLGKCVPGSVEIIKVQENATRR